MDSHLISFEGIECSGKSTQIKLFCQYLEEEGYSVSVFREPGTTKLGEKIRSILLDSHLDKVNISAQSELLLFLSSRAQLLNEEVLPLLKNKKQVVILDRYLDSSIAYQGGGRNLGVEVVRDLHLNFPPLNRLPDITFFLNIDLETSLKRMQVRNEEEDRMEKAGRDFHSRVHKAYLELLEKEERIKDIDAEGNIETVSQNLIKAWESYLNE